MARIRFSPQSDPLLNSFKEFWNTPFNQLVDAYLYSVGDDSVARYDSLYRHIINPKNADLFLDYKKQLIKDLEFKKKENTKIMTKKEYLILGLLQTYCVLDLNSAIQNLKLAQEEDGNAELQLSLCYLHGVSKNVELSNDFLHKSHKLGNPLSLVELGVRHYRGIGFPIDYQLGFEYISKAMTQNIAMAYQELYNLCVHIERSKDEQEERRWHPPGPNDYRGGYPSHEELNTSEKYDYAKKGASLGLLSSLSIAANYRDFNRIRKVTYLREVAKFASPLGKTAINELSKMLNEYKNEYKKDENIPQLIYHAAIALNDKHLFNEQMKKSPLLFDELIRNDEWRIIKPLLNEKGLKEFLERNEDYAVFEKTSVLMQTNTNLPPQVSNIILSYFNDSPRDDELHQKVLKEKEKARYEASFSGQWDAFVRSFSSMFGSQKNPREKSADLQNKSKDNKPM